MIQAAIRLKVSPEKAAEVEAILRGVVERILHSPGCLGCHAYRDLEDSYVLLFEEIWQNQADLDRHLCSDTCRYVIEVVEMAVEPPQIRFNTISRSTGLETIADVRGSLPGAGVLI